MIADSGHEKPEAQTSGKPSRYLPRHANGSLPSVNAQRAYRDPAESGAPAGAW